jgi:hypothetical protein
VSNSGSIMGPIGLLFFYEGAEEDSLVNTTPIAGIRMEMIVGARPGISCMIVLLLIY